MIANPEVLLGRGRSLSVADTLDTRHLVTGTTFDGIGRLDSRVYGNGVTRSYGYDPVWGAVAGVFTEYGQWSYLVHMGIYERDQAGRVIQIDELDRGFSGGDVQCYTYDAFNRLDTAWSGECSWDLQAVAAYDASLRYAVDYDYTATGRVTAVTNLLESVARTYSYADTAHPNAVTSVTGAGETDTFTYDDAGRMVTRDVNDTTTDLVWDVGSNLVATSGQGGDIVYVYTAGGQRIAQISVGDLDAPIPTRATVYLGATEATDPDTGSGSTGDVVASRYYTFAGATVATATAATGSAPAWQLLFGDVQGSVSTSMELIPNTSTVTGFEPADTSHTITRDAYLPYGGARGSEDISTDRGWLGQYEDTGTGLTYLNARYYDPVLGRFLSPDPLLNPGDPRTLDPYRYADNNPITYTDATGLSPNCGHSGSMEFQRCIAQWAQTQTASASTKAYLSQQVTNLNNAIKYSGSSTTKTWGPGYAPSSHNQDYIYVGGIAPQPGLGQVVGGAFITTSMAGIPGMRSAGDGRGFDHTRTWIESRFSFVIDYETGSIILRVNRSCRNRDHTDCIAATPDGVSFKEEPYIGSSGYNHRFNNLIISEFEGATAISIDFAKKNPAVSPQWMVPELNLSFMVVPTGIGEVLVDVYGDAYPSVEVYRIAPSGQVTPLIQSWQPYKGTEEMAFVLYGGGIGRGLGIG